MIRRMTSLRPRRALVAVAVAAAMLAGLPAASAAPTAPTAPLNPALTPYGGGGTADMVVLDLLQIPGAPQLVDVGLAHSFAQVDSQGIGGGAARSTASGDEATDLSVLGLDLDVLADASQSAPPDAGAPDTDTSIALDGGAILQLNVADALARARWASDELCIAPGEPISLGSVETAGVTVGPENGLIGMLSLEALLGLLDSLGLIDALSALFDEASLTAALEALGLGVVNDLLDRLGFLGDGVQFLVDQILAGLDAVGLLAVLDMILVDGVGQLLDLLRVGAGQIPSLGELLDQIGLLEALEPLGLAGLLTEPVLDVGAVTSEVTVTLVEAPGLAPGHYALETSSTVTLASLSVLGGLIEIGVSDDLSATATATGDGAASAETDIPLLDISIAGQELPSVDATLLAPVQELVNQLLGSGGLLSQVGLDALLTLDLSVAGSVTDVAPDGTTASAAASLLGLDLTLLGQDLLGLTVAPVVADAAVPVGGVNCGDLDNPLRELNKHASATEVAPGGTFEYNISVPNRGPCALTDVVVTDVVTGPGRIVDTEPDASLDGNTATWDIGDLAVNETVNLTITVQVDDAAADGATFDDDVVATGVCDGRPVEETDELDDIPTVTDDFTGPCSVQFSNKDASHITVTPGQTYSYYVHAYNTGADACTDVDVVDTLDDRLSFVSCNKGCTNAGQSVTWNVASIPGGSSVVFSVVVRVDDDATGELANVAVIDPGNGDPKTVRSTGPTIGLQSVPKDPASASRGPSGPLPRTGGAGPAAATAMFAAAGLALLALRRRGATA